jgi:hypothetical protein
MLPQKLGLEFALYRADELAAADVHDGCRKGVGITVARQREVGITAVRKWRMSTAVQLRRE